MSTVDSIVHILEVLERTGPRIAGKNGAAEILRIKGATLNAKLKTLGISWPRQGDHIPPR